MFKLKRALLFSLLIHTAVVAWLFRLPPPSKVKEIARNEVVELGLVHDEEPLVVFEEKTAELIPAEKAFKLPQKMAKKNTSKNTMTTASVHGLFHVSPSYPQLSRRLGEEGEVVLRVSVDTYLKKLQFLSVVKSSGYSRLDAAAIESIGEARQRQIEQNALAQPFEQEISVLFKLDEN